LLAVSLVILMVVLLRAPETRPVAVAASSPAVLPASSPSPAPAVAVTRPTEKPAAPAAVAAKTSSDEGSAPTAVAPASGKGGAAKLAKRGKLRHRFAKSKTRARALAQHGRSPNTVASARRPRSDLDDLLDAALKE
jgi:hypothetical protein